LNVEYSIEENAFTFTEGGVSFKVPATEIMEKLPGEEARIQYIIARIQDIRKVRFGTIENYMKEIMKLTSAIRDVRRKMEQLDPERNPKKLNALKAILTSYSIQKAIFKEMRYSAKLLEIEEARYRADLAELQA